MLPLLQNSNLNTKQQGSNKSEMIMQQDYISMMVFQRDKFLLTSCENPFINLIEMHVNYCNFILN